MRIKEFSILFITCLLASCVSKKEDGVVVTDATLFSMVNTVTSFAYYKNNTDTLNADPGSDHVPFVRIRFNPKAQTAMNDSVSRLTLQTFPDESMIVKENYNSRGGQLQYYVIMYKLKGAANSYGGWVWSKMNVNGKVIYSSALKGDQCIGCHTSPDNTDLVKTFYLH